MSVNVKVSLAYVFTNRSSSESSKYVWQALYVLVTKRFQVKFRMNLHKLKIKCLSPCVSAVSNFQEMELPIQFKFHQKLYH